MPAVDAFNATVTNVQLSGPEDLTGLERIMLVAQGDLQRLLSAFFARPITIELVHAHTSPSDAPASPAAPIVQERRVHLRCGARVVCVATSRVTLTAPEPARLLLAERFALGQLFRALRCAPAFELLAVDARVGPDGRRELSRRYRLGTEGCECEIEEVFPDREMFVLGERWLDMDEGAELGAEEKLQGGVLSASEPGVLWRALSYVFPWLSKENSGVRLR